MTPAQKQEVKELQEARRRLNCLEARYRSMARKWLIGATVFSIAVVAGFAWLTSQNNKLADQAHQLTAVVKEQQASRVRASEDRCLLSNATNQGIRDFIGQIQPLLDPDQISVLQLTARAEQQFKVEKDCAKYAKKVTKLKKAQR